MRWRHVLELARDEEARLAGADGADLAAAILSAAQLQTVAAGSAATLLDGSIGLDERVNRLLAPMSAETRVPSRAAAFALGVVSVAGILVGMHFGDTFVQAIVRWL